MVPLKSPAWFNTPTAQVVLVGFTCFSTVGMFTAVSNLGAGGTGDIRVFDISQGVLYGTAALSGFVSGSICNMLGPRLTLFLGTFGYALYVGALWCLQVRDTRWFLITSGALLGFSASLLWSAQGVIMMSYPLEKDKGKAFSIFWAIFQSGSLLGSLISLGINLRAGGLAAVSTSTYIAFLVIIFCGVASALFVRLPHQIVRSDGTRVSLPAVVRPRTEAAALARQLRDWRILALVPMSFASNFAYAYQGAVNAGRFDAPTRALNATLEGAGAIVGALLIGFCVLDVRGLRRRARGYLGVGVVAAITVVVWGTGLAWQVRFTRADAAREARINFRESAWSARGALYFFYFFNDACYQALAYWIMSALTNDPFKLARYTGFYKAVQAAGSAASFAMDATATPYLNEHLATWCMFLFSFPLVFMVVRTIKETNYTEEDVVYVEDLKREQVDAAVVPASGIDEDEKGEEADVKAQV